MKSHHSEWSPLSANSHQEQHTTSCDEIDYSDYVDDGDDADGRSHHSSTKTQTFSAATTVYEVLEPLSTREEVEERHQDSSKGELTIINGHHHHQCNQRNQFQLETTTGEVYDVGSDEGSAATQEEQKDAPVERNHCPHHPRAQLVRFDLAGQAWCDKMDCWDCFRLMKIGEALEYRRLMNEAGKVVIDESMASWSAFVRSQRAFPVVVATEQAMALCKTLDIEVPDVSDKVKRLVEVRPPPD